MDFIRRYNDLLTYDAAECSDRKMTAVGCQSRRRGVFVAWKLPFLILCKGYQEYRFENVPLERGRASPTINLTFNLTETNGANLCVTGAYPLSPQSLVVDHRAYSMNELIPVRIDIDEWKERDHFVVRVEIRQNTPGLDVSLEGYEIVSKQAYPQYVNTNLRDVSVELALLYANSFDIEVTVNERGLIVYKGEQVVRSLPELFYFRGKDPTVAAFGEDTTMTTTTTSASS